MEHQKKPQMIQQKEHQKEHQIGRQMERENVIQVRDLGFEVDRVQILHNIELAIEEREFVGLIGPNGCGKSTLLKNIYRKYEPNYGSVYIHGTDVKNIKNKEAAKLMAVVTQENLVGFDFSVLELVMMGRYAHKKPLQGQTPEDLAICREALRRVGMQEFEKRSVLSLSGGEKQRIYLAAAFAQQSRIIVLDEPTNHLDIGYQLLIMDTLKQQKDTTIFTSVHDMNLAARYCQRIIAMDRGRIVACGPPDQVLTEDLMRSVFHVETRIQREGSDGPLLIQYLRYTE